MALKMHVGCVSSKNRSVLSKVEGRIWVFPHFEEAARAAITFPPLIQLLSLPVKLVNSASEMRHCSEYDFVLKCGTVLNVTLFSNVALF